MSEEDGRVIRQWVSTATGSCDVRLGAGALDRLAQVLHAAGAKPHVAALILSESVPENLREDLRRSLRDGDYLVKERVLLKGAGVRCLDSFSDLAGWFAENGITADDVVVAAGDADTLSVAAQLCSTWVSGIDLAIVPTDLDAAIEVVATPRALDVGGLPLALDGRAGARIAIVDPACCSMDPGLEQSHLAYVQMIITAMCESEKSFSALWDRSVLLADGDEAAVFEQVCETLRSRGHIISSSALALRQSLVYGSSFALVLGRLAGPSPLSVRLAEGLRFAARLSCGMGDFSVEDVLAQDELLDRFGIGQLRCHLDPDELVSALRDERFSRTNRFLLALPKAIGRVRLSSVEEDLLHEHAGAWCEMHASLDDESPQKSQESTDDQDRQND